MKPIELINIRRQHLARLANQRGASGEVSAIAQMNNWVSRPSGKGLEILLSALEETGIVIKRSSFDAIAIPLKTDIDFNDSKSVRASLPEMTFIEIKTASQDHVTPDFSGSSLLLHKVKLLRLKSWVRAIELRYTTSAPVNCY